MKTLMKALSTLFVLSLIGIFPMKGTGETQRESDREKEWSDVSAIVGQFKGVFEEAPLTANLEGDRTTAEAPILGNGTLGVIIAGTDDSLNLYLTSSQFWTNAPSQLGGVRITTPDKGDGNAAYRTVQDIANAEVRATMRFNGYPLNVRCFLAPNESTLITELKAVDPTTPVTFDVETWCRQYLVASGRNGGSVWSHCESPFKPETGEGRQRRGPQPSCSGAIVATVIGGERKTKDDADAPMMRIFLPPGETAYVVTHVLAGREKKDCLEKALARVRSVEGKNLREWDDQRAAWWKDYWLRSYVDLPDRDIAEYYYACLYLIGSAFREGSHPPTLYGPWVGATGPTWGGYILDYNFAKNHIAQTTANRLEQDNFYDVLIKLIPAAREKARSVKEVDGLPTPDGFPGILLGFNCGPFGNTLVYNEACIRSNAALNAIPFIRRYEYTLDRSFLEKYAYPYLKEAALFYAAYVKKDESGRYVMPDSHAREAFPLDPTKDNAALDLLLIPPVWERAIEYSKILGVDAELRADWREKLDNFSSVATYEQDGNLVIAPQEGRTGQLGPMDNPCALFGLYPGHEGGWREIWRNSVGRKFAWYQHNGFGLYQGQAVVAGWNPDDLYEKFRKAIREFRRANLTYWAHLHCLEYVSGVAAVNMMMLGCRDELDFFPVWPANRSAAFTRLRTRGAFLVNGRIEENVVQLARIYSEMGAPCAVKNPWPGTTLTLTCDGKSVPTEKTDDVYRFSTEAGKTYVLSPNEGIPPRRRIEPPPNLALNKPARQSSTSNTGQKALVLAEVEVYGQDTNVNLARGKSAAQSSSRKGCGAEKAIDGTKEESRKTASLASTETESEPWWELDLGSDYFIRDIKIFPTAEGGEEALEDFTVSILDQNHKEVWSRFTEKCVSWSSGKKDRKLLKEITLRTTTNSISAQGIKGRYVRVQLKKVGQAELAVDGGTSGWMDDGSVTLTLAHEEPWWQVDLEKTYRIGKITVQNRGDYLTVDKFLVERLQEFCVIVLGEDEEKVVWKQFCPYTPYDRITFDAQGTRGRYVKIKMEASVSERGKKSRSRRDSDLIDTKRLSLAEVVVEEQTGEEKPANVALGKRTKQSSTNGSTEAARAVDGNTDGAPSSESLAMTQNEDNPWWEVDLGSNHAVELIRLFNRTDNDLKVLRNFKVELLDQDRMVVWQKVWKNYPNPYMNFYTDVTLGRYVRVSLAYKESLGLAEVEVYGEKISTSQ